MVTRPCPLPALNLEYSFFQKGLYILFADIFLGLEVGDVLIGYVINIQDGGAEKLIGQAGDHVFG